MEAIAVAIEAAHKAGEIILRHFRQPQEIRTKGPQDIVTQVDLDAEDIIVRTIRRAFPGHEFLGEEGHTADRDAEHLWVIDPLDGTRNYAAGIPFFCVSIALSVQGRAVLGVIYDPLHGETFSAETGAGFLPAQNAENPGLSLPMLMRLRPAIAAMRNMGSAALSLAYVACGRLDIAYHDRLSAWDLLAGALLIEEAGGIATDLNGQAISTSSRDIIAANSPALHVPVLHIAQEVLKERKTRTG